MNPLKKHDVLEILAMRKNSTARKIHDLRSQCEFPWGPTDHFLLESIQGWLVLENVEDDLMESHINESLFGGTFDDQDFNET